MRLFFSPDVLGPTGRLADWLKVVANYKKFGRWEGLNFLFQPKISAYHCISQLAEEGIAVDSVGEEVRACFALSMFQEDVEAVLATLAKYQG